MSNDTTESTETKQIIVNRCLVERRDGTWRIHIELAQWVYDDIMAETDNKESWPYIHLYTANMDKSKPAKLFSTRQANDPDGVIDD